MAESDEEEQPVEDPDEMFDDQLVQAIDPLWYWTPADEEEE